MRRRTLASLLSFAPFALGAQSPSAARFPGRFLSARAVARDSAAQRCLALGHNTYISDVQEAGLCRSDGVQSLSRVGETSWFYATYHRRWLLSAADTARETEVVVFNGPTEQSTSWLTPVWHYRYEDELLGSLTPAVVRRPDNSVLMTVVECLNGTGGCGQSFASYREGRWYPIALQFLDSLDRRNPGSIQHGFRVDVETLRGEVPLYSPQDGNCCPSRIAIVVLRLQDDALYLDSLQIRPTRP